MNNTAKLTVIAGLAFGLVAAPAAGAFAATPAPRTTQSSEARPGQQASLTSTAPKGSVIATDPTAKTAVVRVSGQEVAGSQFVVTANGKTQTVPADGRGAADVTVSARTGATTVWFRQISGTRTTVAGTTTARLESAPAATATPAPSNASQTTDPAAAKPAPADGPAAQSDALDPSKAPTVALIESWPLRGEASFSLSGQRVSGAEFVVEVNGTERRVQSSTGSSFVFIKNFKQGMNTVTVTQQLDGVSTIAGTTTYESYFNGSEYTDLTNPAIVFDPSRPIDPGFTAGPILADGFDKTKAPAVSLIERQGLSGASILVKGQDVKGTWFVVTVTQESNGVQSPAGTLTIRVG